MLHRKFAVIERPAATEHKNKTSLPPQQTIPKRQQSSEQFRSSARCSLNGIKNKLRIGDVRQGREFSTTHENHPEQSIVSGSIHPRARVAAQAKSSALRQNRPLRGNYPPEFDCAPNACELPFCGSSLATPFQHGNSALKNASSERVL
jgi:hypothetical protein